MAADDDLDRRIAEASAAVEALRLQSSKLDEELELRAARVAPRAGGAEEFGAPGPSAALPAPWAPAAPPAAVQEALQQPLDATQPSPLGAARVASAEAQRPGTPKEEDERCPDVAPGAALPASRTSSPAAEVAEAQAWEAARPTARSPSPEEPAPPAAREAAAEGAERPLSREEGPPPPSSPSPEEPAPPAAPEAAAERTERPLGREDVPPPRQGSGPPRRRFSRPGADSPDAAEGGAAGRVPVPPPGPRPAHAQQARAAEVARPPRGAAGAPPRPDSHPYPSDADVASMSRRERIALLEEGSGAADRPALAPRRAPPRGAAAEGGAAEAGPAQGGAAPEGGGDLAEDDDWERRRLERRARLQRHAGPRAARGGSEGHGEDRAAPAAAAPAPRAPPRAAAGAGGGPAAAEAPSAGGRAAAAAAPATGQALLQELDGASRLGFEDPRWLSTCAALKGGAHMLTVGQLLRAVECLASAPRGAGGVGAAAANSACREAADALLACLAPQLGSLGVAAVVDALRLMASFGVAEQTYLDMLLSQLAVLGRRDRAALAVSVVAAAGSIGSLHANGVSAKKAASAAGSAANKRCVEFLAEEVVARLGEFREEQLAGVGAPFVVSFLDDTQRRAFLRRSAELEVGLRVTSSEWLGAMKEIERAVRSQSFAFVASLPDQAKDYLMRLKAAG